MITRETTNITVINPDEGVYALGFIDPRTGTNYASARINTNCSAWEMNLAVREFYRRVYNAPINVIKTMFTEDGDVTTNVRNHTTAVYSITVQRSLDLVTTN